MPTRRVAVSSLRAPSGQLLVETGYGRATTASDGSRPDYAVRDLAEAAQVIARCVTSQAR